MRRTSNRLVSTWISSALLDESGLLWTRLWQSFLLLDEAFATEAGEAEELADGPNVFLGVVQEALCRLYSRTDAVPLEVLVALATTSLLEDAGSSSEKAVLPRREAVRKVLRRVLDQWR